MDELLNDFLIETGEGLAMADEALLRLERQPQDQETLGIIFRAVHTIKGSCGFLPLPRLERLAHAAEDVLGRVRDNVIQADSSLISTVLATLDRIKLIVQSISSVGQEPPGDDSALIARLSALHTAPQPASAASAASTANPASTAPEDAAQEPTATHTPAQTIRVGVGVLESLMTLVSELVLTRNQLIQLSRTHEDTRFAAALQRLSHLTSDLQEGVMKTRMQPIGQVRNALTRLVRDLAHDLGKRIELTMIGEDTELDRQVLELMRDPLIHMVRNSADHGLESTAARRAAGKPEAGTITLNAYHEAGHVVIELGDDGAGLHTERIRARVLAHGLATVAELAVMTNPQIEHFIFRPGFTTAASITAVSGRGVGMDVVKANVERIGGSIELQSTPGAGTRFTVKIPLTLAIISAFIVEAHAERFALPQSCVVELVRIGEDGEQQSGQPGPLIEMVDGAPMLRLRERLLPLVHLDNLLKLRPFEPNRNLTGSIIVVAAVGSVTLGLVVDQVFDTEEIVVKPVAPLLRHITMFGGTTILGDGSVIMILEPNGLAKALGFQSAEQRLPSRKNGEAAERSGDLSPMLLFRGAAGAVPAAVPLGLVARIEELPFDRIERSSGRPVTQYRGRLMPLIAIDPAPLTPDQRVPVLVFADRQRSMGLIVHQIVDVVEEKLVIELSAARPGLLGTAIIDGRVTDVIDAGYWLIQAWQDWFQQEPHQAVALPRILVVEDSAFFRQLMVPMLSAAGFDVTAVESGARALSLRDSAVPMFDAIISDVQMPDMDGIEFGRRIRSDGAWQTTPLLALSGRMTDADVLRMHEAGFSECLLKLDRDALLAALRRCLNPSRQLAA